MSTVNVTVTMDEQLKSQAEEVFADFGLTLQDAFTEFAKQAVQQQRIPFATASNPVTVADNASLASVSQKLIEQNIESYKELAK